MYFQLKVAHRVKEWSSDNNMDRIQFALFVCWVRQLYVHLILAIRRGVGGRRGPVLFLVWGRASVFRWCFDHQVLQQSVSMEDEMSFVSKIGATVWFPLSSHFVA
jgi:hypothetical protein